MTLTIFFFTISINKHEPTLEEAIHSEAVKDRIQENKDRYLQMMGRY